MKNVLICFVKYPEPGHVKTRLAVDIGPESAAELYSFLAERVITEIFTIDEKYDIRLYVDGAHDISRFQSWLGEQWTFKTQAGGDLGQRLDAAIGECFEAGYERVMVIGSDCIGMDEEFVANAFDSLDEHDVVIGPSSDGGYYLLGMSSLHSWLFRDMPWSTERVLSETIDRIEVREMTVCRLEEKLDVDTSDDLDRFRKALPEEHFLAHKIDQIVLEAVSRVGQDGENLDLLRPEHYRTKVLDNVVIEMPGFEVSEAGDDDADTLAPKPPIASPESDPMSVQNLFKMRPVSPDHGKKSGR